MCTHSIYSFNFASFWVPFTLFGRLTITSKSNLLRLRLGVQQENPLKGPNISMSFVGTNADFTCVSPLKSCAYITWHQDLRINSAWARIDPDSNPDLRYKYVVENSPLGCKLTVKNVQISDYAPIKCIFLLTFERTADLMVFGKSMACLSSFYSMTVIDPWLCEHT